MSTEHYDVIIIGSGAGGGTLAHRLAPSGKRILILERGGYLPREQENWNTEAVFAENRYKAAETWHDQDGKAFHPGIHYWVGGNTKMYGAVLLRLRERDFGETRHADGVSPAWPLSYRDLAPYYTEAERLYQGQDFANQFHLAELARALDDLDTARRHYLGGLTLTGTGTTAGSGGTIQNISQRGGEFITTKALSLKNMNFTSANTANGANPNVTPSTCGDIASSTDDNTGCNASICAGPSAPARATRTPARRQHSRRRLTAATASQSSSVVPSLAQVSSRKARHGC